jgi:D-arginine dehydrogenase
VAGGETHEAAILVDAAGAWADGVASLAGLPAIGVQPYRRTMVQLRTDPAPPADLPLVVDAAGSFYFKAEGGSRLWLSPHDETPAEPGDAAAEEIDIARAIDRFGKAVDWKVLAVERKWAGLRSFAPDRLPVYGFDPLVPRFFWCAGQGGFGIQTAPAAARLCRALILGEAVEPGIDAALYAPGRFR